jgi:hypothetical protein
MAVMHIIIALGVACSLAQMPKEGTLRVGDTAPNFKLKEVGKQTWFELKSNVGVRPTVLIFGSYT